MEPDSLDSIIELLNAQDITRKGKQKKQEAKVEGKAPGE
jgi:hypothetical protein